MNKLEIQQMISTIILALSMTVNFIFILKIKQASEEQREALMKIIEKQRKQLKMMENGITVRREVKVETHGGKELMNFYTDEGTFNIMKEAEERNRKNGYK